jgi:hypothetical protein
VPHLLSADLREKTEGVCKKNVDILACRPTWRMASSCDWWRVVVFLWYISTPYVDVVARWRHHKIETSNSKQKVDVYGNVKSDWVLCYR